MRKLMIAMMAVVAISSGNVRIEAMNVPLMQGQHVNYADTLSNADVMMQNTLGQRRFKNSINNGELLSLVAQDGSIVHAFLVLPGNYTYTYGTEPLTGTFVAEGDANNPHAQRYMLQIHYTNNKRSKGLIGSTMIMTALPWYVRAKNWVKDLFGC